MQLLSRFMTAARLLVSVCDNVHDIVNVGAVLMVLGSIPTKRVMSLIPTCMSIAVVSLSQVTLFHLLQHTNTKST